MHYRTENLACICINVLIVNSNTAVGWPISWAPKEQRTGKKASLVQQQQYYYNVSAFTGTSTTAVLFCYCCCLMQLFCLFGVQMYPSITEGSSANYWPDARCRKIPVIFYTPRTNKSGQRVRWGSRRAEGGHAPSTSYHQIRFRFSSFNRFDSYTGHLFFIPRVPRVHQNSTRHTATSSTPVYFQGCRGGVWCVCLCCLSLEKSIPRYVDYNRASSSIRSENILSSSSPYQYTVLLSLV